MLEKVTTDLAKCTMGVETPSATMSIFATAFLLLNLAVLTGVWKVRTISDGIDANIMQEKRHLEQCQMLYVNLMSVRLYTESASNGPGTDSASRSRNDMGYSQRQKAKYLI